MRRQTRMKLRALTFYCVIGALVLLLLNYTYRKDTETKPALDEEFDIAESIEGMSVVFIKTHKTGGSTLSQILYRWGLRKSLFFAQYPDNWMRGGRMNVTNLIPLPTGKPHYDIIAQHFVYNKEEVRTLFGDNTFVMTIIRDPVERLSSALNFLGMPAQIKMKFDELVSRGDPLYAKYQLPMNWKTLPIRFQMEIFIDMIEQSLSDSERRTLISQHRMYFNNIARDLGFPGEKLEDLRKIDEAEIDEFIKFIDKELDLVLIQEHFDEGILVLGEALHMQQQDMLYIVENSSVRGKGTAENSDLIYTSQLTPELISKIRLYSDIDVKIYEHFSRKFNARFKIPRATMLDYRTDLWRSYETCVCGRESKGLFGTQSYVLCPDQEENAFCRELLSDSIVLQYVAADKQCKVANISCFNSSVLNDKLENKKLVNKGWEFGKDASSRNKILGLS